MSNSKAPVAPAQAAQPPSPPPEDMAHKAMVKHVHKRMAKAIVANKLPAKRAKAVADYKMIKDNPEPVYGFVSDLAASN